MIATAWNCQGLGNTLTVRHLRDISSQYAPQVYFLMETKQRFNYMETVCKDLKCSDLFTVEPQGASGGLCLMWNEDVEVTILSSCNRWIDAKITWQNLSFVFTGIYGDPVTSDRADVWNEVITFGEDREEPWLMMGDFNELYNNDDKRGGRTRPEASFFPFRSMLSRCGLLELPFEGNPLSWFGKRNGELVHCKLDRAVCNTEWFLKFPAATSFYLPRIGSDHSPLLTKFLGNEHKKIGHFRFDPRWVTKEGFEEAVITGWNTPSSEGSDIIANIRNCRSSLSSWKRNHPLNSQVLIRDLKYQLDLLTHQDDFDWAEYTEMKRKLAEAYAEEEKYWKNKSRAQWLQLGDRNTKFFHATVKQKRLQNKIKCLRNELTGQLVYTDKEMGALACTFYSHLFTSELRITSEVRVSAMFQGVQAKITEQQNRLLISPFTESEVKNAVFSMSPNKCAGPDGFTGSFYQHQWSTVGPSVCSLVKDFFESGCFDNRINETTICLIPKKQRPDNLKDFRPISLCNFIYKIISKLMATRLKSILPSIISETQAAFVEGRLISDNILLAHEILHSMKTNSDLCASSVAIKTDMMKAFDRVEWQFLEDSMRVLGFHSTWISWVMHCITTVSFGVLINGQRYGNFSPSRGIRQGDPLSPFLFILCTEVLILRLNRPDPEDQFLGIKIAPTAPSISHLLFADDSLFFSSIDEQQLRLLFRILAEYENASGQKVNLDKSSIIYGPKVSVESKESVQRITGIYNEGGKGVYLGMPEAFLGSKTETLKFIEDKVKKRIGSWKNRFLSQGGKEVLIKSVAQALPTYAMSCYRLPQTMIKSITAEYARFWWKNQDTGTGIYWQSWDKLARRKEEGGLNFRHLDGFNLALLGKQFWRLCNQPHTVLARTLKAKYFPRKSSAYHASIGQRPSFGWRSIMESRELMKLGLKKEFGNGTDIDILLDPWIVDTHPRGVRLQTIDVVPVLDQIKENFSDQWRVDQLPNFFDPEECSRILQVKPGGAESSSYFSWIFNNSGVYSVKSGYWLWNSSLNQGLATEQQPNFSEIFKRIWSANCSNKIRNYLWRSLTSSLSVGKELSKRHISVDYKCKLCGFDTEDAQHLLFSCDLARSIWESPSLLNLFPEGISGSLHENIWHCVSASMDISLSHIEDKHLGPWILWLIWKARNEFIFQRKTTSAQYIIRKARTDALEWLQNTHCSSSSSQPPMSKPPEKWLAPPSSFLKCNIDAAWQESHDRCGVSWILRDSLGAVRLYGIKVYPRLSSPLDAEATALVWALNCIWNMGYDNVIFETDSSTLIAAIQSPLTWPRLLPYTTELQGIVSRRPWQVSFDHIGRARNAAADSLAKHAIRLPLYFGSIDNTIPPWLQPSLEC